MKRPLLVAGDVGGTKTLLAASALEVDGPRLVAERTLPSQTFPGLEPLLESFLADLGRPPVRLCLGLPGPVEGDVCRVTNLPWVVDRQTLLAMDGVEEVVLVNDLVAAGYGLAALEPDQVVELNPQARERPGHRVIIAPGTGCGQVLLFWDGCTWLPAPSEGGHVNFAPRTEEEAGLLNFLQAEHGHVSYDVILSGPGLINIYRYLLARNGDDQGPAPALAGPEPAASIGLAGLAGTDPLARRALDMFVDILGAAAGNLALLLLPRGGVYLAGGIAPKILPALQDGRLLAAFTAKGPMTRLVAGLPLRVVLEPRLGLLGAVRLGWRSFIGSPKGAST